MGVQVQRDLMAAMVVRVAELQVAVPGVRVGLEATVVVLA